MVKKPQNPVKSARSGRGGPVFPQTFAQGLKEEGVSLYNKGVKCDHL
jgi:hypothetical protein